jgi:NTP pyrophosphatase (non-canonical NTP hydrolase)
MIKDYEQELLTITMEECAEVIQACSKVIRYGADSEYGGNTAREILEKELGDLYCMIDLLHKHDLISYTAMDLYADEKLEKLKKWSGLFRYEEE